VPTVNGIRLPEDLIGWSALDAGCYDGAHARACVVRGAAPVTAIDVREYRKYVDWPEPVWDIPGVRFVEADLLEWTEPADLVIASNVIYHIDDPFAALIVLRRLTLRTLLLRTSFVGGNEEKVGRDGWTWYPNRMGHPSGTVPCRPSPGGLVASLKEAGFTTVNEQSRDGDHLVVEAR